MMAPDSTKRLLKRNIGRHERRRTNLSNDMGIKRLDHVCWAVHRLDDVLPLLTKLMGMTIEGRFENPEVGFRGVGLRVPGGTGHFELLEPYGENSYLHKFLDEKGPGLHHVTFEVEDADKAAEAITEFGIKPWGGVNRSHGWVETFIHPKDSGGVLFQFYHEDEEHEHAGPAGHELEPAKQV
jgi:methylmalonyl-CoA/ethylmalonyl-CoA epimerase